MWNWIKEKWKKFKKLMIIIGSLGTATVLAFSLGNSVEVEFITAPENNTFTIGVMNYESSFAPNSANAKTLQYKLDDKFISFKPSAVYIDGQKVLNANNIQKFANRNKYDNVFNGIDLEVFTRGRVWNKVLEIKNPAFLDLIPQQAQTISIEFEVESNFVINGWDRKSNLEVVKKIRIGDFSYLEQAQAWDSYREDVVVEIQETECGLPDDPCETGSKIETLTNRINLKTVLSSRGNKLFFTKEIPIDWLRDAQFPVYTDADVTYGTKQVFDNTTLVFQTHVAEIGTNKFVVCWTHSFGFDGNDGFCSVGTVSGTTITFGSSLKYQDDVVLFGEDETDVCKVDDNKFAISYMKDAANDDGFTVIGSSSATTIEYGTEVEFETGDTEWSSCGQLTTDAYAICYNDETDSDTGKCVANTVSGLTITAGTPTAIDGNGGATKDFYPENNSVANIGTNKFVNCFREEETEDDGMCVVGTVATRTITFSVAPSDFDTDSTVNVGVSKVNTDDQFVVAYDADGGKTIAATISGSTITYGTAQLHVSTTSGNIAYHNESATINSTQHVLVYEQQGATDEGLSRLNTVDWGTRGVTLGDAEVFEDGNVGGSGDYGIDITLISSNKVVICYQDDDDSDFGYCIIGDVSAVAAVAAQQQDSWIFHLDF